MFYWRAFVSRASRPERGRDRATGSAEGITAVRPGRPRPGLKTVQKVLGRPRLVSTTGAQTYHPSPWHSCETSRMQGEEAPRWHNGHVLPRQRFNTPGQGLNGGLLM